MANKGKRSTDRQLTTADELLRNLMAEARDGRELEVAAQLERLASRAAGARLEILARASAAAPGDLKIIPIAEQIHASNRCTIKTAKADVRLATLLAGNFQLTRDALIAGQISEAHAKAILVGMKNYPLGLSSKQLEACQQELISLAQQFDPDELRQLALRMVEAIDPDLADALMADRVEREARLAFERRFVIITPDHHGSMLIKGQLPVADGELLLAQLDALMPSSASYEEAPPKPTRRADALVRLTQVAANSGELPARGADRPQVIVTLSLEDLKAGLAGATLLGSGEHLTAREARRLACDANLIPAVLGADGQPLDVGRAQRLYTGALRTALVLRDQGCAFPGCDAPASACEGHHTVPWVLGGETSLANGVLLCPFHHRMVEPDPCRRPEHNWEITLDETGNPWFAPPRQVDLKRRPRQHHRYRLRGRTLPTLDPPEPGDAAAPPDPSRLGWRLAPQGPELVDQIDLLQPGPNWV